MPTVKTHHRDLSWRKPVPMYIPSPPPTPRPTSAITLNRLSYSLSDLHSDIPPLPFQWREMIDRALSPDPQVLEICENTSSGHDSTSALNPRGRKSSRREQIFSMVEVNTVPILSNKRYTYRKRTMSQQLPTMPRPVYQRQGALSDMDSDITISVPWHVVYPDPPASMDETCASSIDGQAKTLRKPSKKSIATKASSSTMHASSLDTMGDDVLTFSVRPMSIWHASALAVRSNSHFDLEKGLGSGPLPVSEKGMAVAAVEVPRRPLVGQIRGVVGGLSSWVTGKLHAAVDGVARCLSSFFPTCSGSS